MYGEFGAFSFRNRLISADLKKIKGFHMYTVKKVML